MLLTVALMAAYVVHAAVSVWAHVQIRRFVTETPTIADQGCLERYKDLVRVQMYLALFTIGVLGAGIVIGMVLIVRYGVLGFLLVMMGSAWLLVSGLFMRTSEVRARNLSAASDALAEEYRRVSSAWVKKPLPDF